jgi:hypothetical protein
MTQVRSQGSESEGVRGIAVAVQQTKRKKEKEVLASGTFSGPQLTHSK